MAQSNLAHDNTKSQLFELSAKLEKQESNQDSGTAMLTEELERATTQLAALRREKVYFFFNVDFDVVLFIYKYMINNHQSSIIIN